MKNPAYDPNSPMSDERPILFARLGKDNLLQGDKPWIPSKNDLKEFEDYLKERVGDRYTVIVYHSGADLKVID